MNKFTNIEEALKDKRCIYYLNKQIDSIKYARKNIYQDMILKRSPIDYLEEHEIFTAEKLIFAYINIINKTNTMPSNVRKTIKEMVRDAILETIKYYEIQ